MGIKFHCPNGHKLNVKAFLAGKKGVCPKCGTKFRIPAESEPGLVDSDLEEGDAGASGIKSGNGSPAANRPHIATAAAPATSRSHEGDAPAAAIAASRSKAVPSVPPTPAGTADPIGEAPQAVWYVRPPTGGEFGPLAARLAQLARRGRVTSDSLVWREGWPIEDAGKVFPALGPPLGSVRDFRALVGLTAPPRATRPPRPAVKKGTSRMAIAI
jgi:hypothetical protein